MPKYINFIQALEGFHHTKSQCFQIIETLAFCNTSISIYAFLCKLNMKAQRNSESFFIIYKLIIDLELSPSCNM